LEKGPNVLKKILAVVLVAILLALPLAVRWLYFFEGHYQPGKVNRPDLAAVAASTPEIEPFADRFAALPPGTTLVDQAHDNRFHMSELNILQARLSARGQQLEPVVATADLPDQLRYAKALVVISPGKDWTPVEIEQVRQFVDKGGRLLLITDPTRFTVETDDLGSFTLDYDTPHVNELAARFDLLFQSDYLYNTVDNEGNFRNIKLTEFGDSNLVEGLSEVVFYATHSIISQEPALIAAGGQTRSSNSQRGDALAVAVLAADGRVLALGDMTFLTEPYNAAYDNDRLIANIADFLGTGQRQYKLTDFPFFFGDRVDLVFAGNPLLDGDLLASGSNLQALFADIGRELTIRATEDEARDTLFVGLYQEAEDVEPYLAAGQVTVLITPTESSDVEATTGPTSRPAASSSPPITGPLTTTPQITPGLEITITPALRAESEVTTTAEISPTAQSRIVAESMGEMVLTGTSLLLLATSGERHVLVVLADTEAGLDNAVERLTTADLEGCLLQETQSPTRTALALCPTAEVAAGDGAGGWREPEPKPTAPTPEPSAPVTGTNEVVTGTIPPPEPAGEPEGSIIVIAMDLGEGRYDSITSMDDYVAILKGRYEVTTWSLAEDGVPEGTDLLDYDLVVWTFGDYESQTALEEVADALITVMFGEVPFIMSGAYIGDSDTQAVLRDIQVSDAAHPIAQGFAAGQVIDLVPPPSGAEYEVNVLSDVQPEEGTTVFVRGPRSDSAGSPAIYATADAASNVRFVFIGLPVYLLPEEAKTEVVLNTVGWLLNP
jgi:hypothetical protein